ncbi:MAG: NAD/NADP octopine/nopaline dehydrogenase family protein [Dehalococcoidales bacterium]|nr:NAD/NADP octopine/nopaline dehydrogenase family protein [Dehalococcoidales bacterium]
MTNPTIAVLGAGNGAHAFAGDLGRRGYRVRLYNKFAHEIAHLQAAGGVQLEDAIVGFGPLEMVTTDIEPVVSGADLILVVVPAIAHAAMAEACAPYLRPGQIVVLNPGRTGGAMEFRQILRGRGVDGGVLVAEAQTLLYTCRLSGPACVRVTTIKRQVPLAALPARDTPAVLSVLNSIYPQFVAAADVIETGLDNIGAVFHPATVILSAARIESGVQFEFYRDMTPAVVRMLEAVDEERLATAEAYGVRATSASDWLGLSYDGIEGETLYERLRSNPAYAGISAPTSIETRYVLEDVPTGLVPIASLGRLAGLEMSTIGGLVDVACALYRRDFWREGRNSDRLGIAGLSVDEAKTLIRDEPVVAGQASSLPCQDQRSHV